MLLLLFGATCLLLKGRLDNLEVVGELVVASGVPLNLVQRNLKEHPEEESKLTVRLREGKAVKGLLTLLGQMASQTWQYIAPDAHSSTFV